MDRLYAQTRALSPGKEAAVTRESKLALIIGFVLVLLVGVLVSDHFSQASNMDLDMRGEQPTGLEMPIAQLGLREQQAIDQAIDRTPKPIDQTTGHDAQRLAYEQPRETPVIISNSPESSSIIDQVFDEARRIANETRFEKLAQPTKPDETQTAEPSTIRDLPEKTYRTYTVVSGDSLIGIARRLLGDGERWLEIESLNADQLGPDSILQIGMKLRLPGDARILSNTPIKRQSSSNATARTYTVQRGDTLGEISSKLLGTTKRMDEIVELNGLASPDQIYVGMTLKIPTK